MYREIVAVYIICGCIYIYYTVCVTVLSLIGSSFTPNQWELWNQGTESGAANFSVPGHADKKLWQGGLRPLMMPRKKRRLILQYYYKHQSSDGCCSWMVECPNRWYVWGYPVGEWCHVGSMRSWLMASDLSMQSPQSWFVRWINADFESSQLKSSYFLDMALSQ